MVSTVHILIARHGKAEPISPNVPDEKRKLTDEGRRDVELITRAIPIRVSKVISSPLVRAIETSEIIAKVHGVSVEISNELRPEKCSLESISRLKIDDGTVLVGHAPSIERVLSELVGGNIKLKAGAIAGLELEELGKGKATLVFLIIPDNIKKFMSMK